MHIDHKMRCSVVAFGGAILPRFRRKRNRRHRPVNMNFGFCISHSLVHQRTPEPDLCIYTSEGRRSDDPALTA